MAGESVPAQIAVEGDCPIDVWRDPAGQREFWADLNRAVVMLAAKEGAEIVRGERRVTLFGRYADGAGASLPPWGREKVQCMVEQADFATLQLVVPVATVQG